MLKMVAWDFIHDLKAAKNFIANIINLISNGMNKSDESGLA